MNPCETTAELTGFFPRLGPDALPGLRGYLPTWALSTESAWQQWGLAEGIVRGASDNQELLGAAAALLAWSWQERPLHGPTVSLLATLEGQLGFWDREKREYLLALKKRLRPQPERELWEQVRALGDRNLLALYLERALPGPGGLSLLGEAWEDLVCLEDQELALRLLRTAVREPRLSTRLEAELALHQRRPEEALALAHTLSNTPFAPFGTFLAAHLHILAGQREEALCRMAALWRAMPWNANLTLRLHDLALLPPPGPLPDAPTAILVYTWNKAELAGQTLESVFASDIGDNRVFVLDNGSTDATAALLTAKREQWGPHRLHVVSLPINVGAPAARNWLLSLPEVRACRYAAFLDDDVILPPNWLARLLEAAVRHPECGTIGCSIRDAAPPARLQSADYHILHRQPGNETEPGERIRIFNNCTGTLDMGLFGYERPCLSVSGCCHLLDLSALDAVGGFDVRFTPTQFDDLDRDLRSWLAGRPCLYAGQLAIGHVQRSSLRQADSPAQVAHVLGNKIKLEGKYDDASLDALIAGNFELAWKDLLCKHAALGARFSG